MKVTGERFVPGKMFKHSEIEHMHRYSILKKLLADKIVLDAACGTGYGSDMIATVADSVYGIDISQEAIAYATATFKDHPNLKYIEADISQLPFPDGMFDVVVSFETIEHVNAEIQIKFLAEIRRVLKPEGLLIMSTPNKEIYTVQAGNQPTEWHVKEFFEDEFDCFIKKEFCYVRYFQQYISKASYLLDNDADTVRMADVDKNKKGKFVIAVACNGKESLLDEIQMNSIYYYPDEYAELDEICQIFYSSSANKNFTEENSEIIEVSSGKKEICIHAEIDSNEGINRLRIDPLNNSCCIENFHIEILLKNHEQIQLSDFINNADEIIDGSFFFYHRDPQYVIEFEQEMHIEEVVVHFAIRQYNLDVYSYMQNKNQKLAEVLEQERIQINRERSLLEEKSIFYSSATETINNQRNSISKEYEAMCSERNSIRKEREAMHNERDSIERERETIRNECDSINKEREGILRERNSINSERQAIDTERTAILKEREAIQNERTFIAGEQEAIIAERLSLENESRRLAEEREKFINQSLRKRLLAAITKKY